jgi:ferric-dicitrate binding protein FerR (iron transport regulator)
MQCQERLRRLAHFGAVLLFVFALPQIARAQGKDHVGVVQRLQGHVSIGAAGMALDGMDISLQDKLVTGAGARLQIRLTDDTQVTLGENAEAVFTQYQFSPSISGGKGVVAFKVGKGAFLFTTGRISQLSDKRIEVKTAFADIATTGSEFFAGQTGGDLEGVAVFEGTLEVSNQEGTIVLSARGFTQSRVQSQTQGLGLRSRSSADPIGTTLGRGRGPSQPVIWPREQTDRAVDAVTFDSEIAGMTAR